MRCNVLVAFCGMAAADWLEQASNLVNTGIWDVLLPTAKRWLHQSSLDAVWLNSSAISKTLQLAQLSQLAYVSDRSHLKESVAAMGCPLKHFSPQAVGAVQPQWFVCIANDGLHVVFRGTASLQDALADMLVRPRVAESSLQLHGGFLQAFRFALRHGLRELLLKLDSQTTVHLLGHSLGGALAMTALLSGELARATYRVTTFGAPAVLFGAARNYRERHGAKIQQWILENDPVPRVLGSKLKFLNGLLSTMKLESGVGVLSKLTKETLEVIPSYSQLPTAELLWLRGRRVYVVAAERFAEIMHLQDAAFDGRSLGHHSIDSYVLALQTVPDDRAGLQRGKAVKIVGLGGFEGRRGRCERWVEEKGQWLVVLSDGSQKRFLPSNLRPLGETKSEL